LRHDVVRVFVSLCVLVFVRAILSWLPLDLTCLHCLQHSLFEHLFNLYWLSSVLHGKCEDQWPRSISCQSNHYFVVNREIKRYQSVPSFSRPLDCNMWKVAASVLLKLLVNYNKRYHTTVVPSAWAKIYVLNVNNIQSMSLGDHGNITLVSYNFGNKCIYYTLKEGLRWRYINIHMIHVDYIKDNTLSLKLNS